MGCGVGTKKKYICTQVITSRFTQKYSELMSIFLLLCSPTMGFSVNKSRIIICKFLNAPYPPRQQSETHASLIMTIINLSRNV